MNGYGNFFNLSVFTVNQDSSHPPQYEYSILILLKAYSSLSMPYRK